MRYILKAESYARKGQAEKLYCIIAGSAVNVLSTSNKLGKNLGILILQVSFIDLF